MTVDCHLSRIERRAGERFPSALTALARALRTNDPLLLQEGSNTRAFGRESIEASLRLARPARLDQLERCETRPLALREFVLNGRASEVRSP